MSIIETIRAEVERLKPRIRKICGEEVKIPVEKVREKFDTLLSFLSDLEKEEKLKRVRTLEKEFDGYNPIVVTLDKYVLKSIGVVRHDEVIIKIQRKED